MQSHVAQHHYSAQEEGSWICHVFSCNVWCRSMNLEIQVNLFVMMSMCWLKCPRQFKRIQATWNIVLMHKHGKIGLNSLWYSGKEIDRNNCVQTHQKEGTRSPNISQLCPFKFCLTEGMYLMKKGENKVSVKGRAKDHVQYINYSLWVKFQHLHGTK